MPNKEFSRLALLPNQTLALWASQHVTSGAWRKLQRT